MSENRRELAALGYRLGGGELTVTARIERALAEGAACMLCVDARVLGAEGLNIRLARWSSAATDRPDTSGPPRSGVRPMATTPVLLSTLPEQLRIHLWAPTMPEGPHGDWRIALHFTSHVGPPLTWRAQPRPSRRGTGWSASLTEGLRHQPSPGPPFLPSPQE